MMKIAVTGHRPDKLGNSYNLTHPINIEIGKRMREVILVLSGYDSGTRKFRDNEIFTIISGMALGVDTVWAMVALKLKRQFPYKFQLECAVPCKEQERKWNKTAQQRYQNILSQADKVTYVTETTYTHKCMQKRNEYMVNESSYVYGIWDGTSGGTKNCIDYAKKQGTLLYVEDPTPWIEAYEKSKSVN
jgi:uncharacterized phage-like protein YoqJ